ncbi:TetR/AcrR family transcriptional regulator [Streptomyces sp. 184]|uniref:TetR/AcrR family transcriptional regulator n=1 Tax=Streptomyces sp. 184 TaxID=1827526 RepID=UPI0038926B35
MRRPSAARNDPPLSRERITEGAIALLDDEGMDRLTMRRLAERLGVGATTLYWHIDTKDDVFDLAIDAIFQEAPLPAEPGPDWREDVVATLSGCRRMLLRHPWSSALPMRPAIGPNFLAWMEAVQAMLVRGGLKGQHVSAAFWLLLHHVQGATTSQSSLQWSDEEISAFQEQLDLRKAQYPTIVEHKLLAYGWEANFHLGLNYALDGIEAQVASDG